MIASLKPYRETKNSGVKWLGAVPAQWEVHRLRSIADMRISNVDKHTREGEQPVRLCNYVDVYKNDQIQSGINFMPATATVEEIERFRLRSGDVLITKDSEAWNDIGVPALVREVEDDIVSGYHLALLRPRTSRIQGDYLFRAIQSLPVAYQFHMRANGVTRYGLTQDAIKSTRIPVPPSGEQAAIARFLDHVERRIHRYIDAKQKLIALLEEQKQAIVDRVITGQIDVDTGGPYRAYKDGGTRWLKQVPKHWDIRPAKWHFREVDERSDSGSEELLSVSHITGVTPRKEKNVTMFMAESNIGDKLCQPGDVVVNTMWAWMAALGVATQTGIVSPSYAVYRPHEHSKLLPSYTELLLRSTPYRSEYNCQSTGIRASRLRLYPEQFLRIRLLCPPVDEQRAIIEFAEKTTETIRRSMDVTRRQLSRMAEFHTRIIADVVTGKVDVRSATASLPEDDFDDTKDQRNDGLRNDATAYPNERNAGVSDCET